MKLGNKDRIHGEIEKTQALKDGENYSKFLGENCLNEQWYWVFCLFLLMSCCRVN